MFWRLTIAVIVMTTAGCSTTAVPLGHAPAANVAGSMAPALPMVVGSFQDARNARDERWIGAIHGEFGNAVATLHADVPVSDLVRNAFVDALKARGIAADARRVGARLEGRIITLECDQSVRREATIKIELVIRDANGIETFTRSYASSRVDRSPLSFSTRVFGSTDEVRAVMDKTLRDTVERALNDSALRAALQV